jgi:phosphatidylglycerophosphate synthase
MSDPQFAGAHKINDSFLAPIERRFGPALVRRIPGWLETYHLTLLTLVWSALIVVFSAWARSDVRWLWLVSLMIACQYLTDHVDGKVGKLRGTGLVRWGYYMDHLLDYVFLCAVIVGYALLLPPSSLPMIMALFAVFGAFMVHTFLVFSVTERFTISMMKLGPTEFRLTLIAVNVLLVRFGTRPMVTVVPYVVAGATVVFVAVVFVTQRALWRQERGPVRDRAGVLS